MKAWTILLGNKLDESLNNPVRQQTNTYLSTCSLLIGIFIWWRGLGWCRNNMEKSGTIPIGTKSSTARAILKNRWSKQNIQSYILVLLPGPDINAGLRAQGQWHFCQGQFTRKVLVQIFLKVLKIPVQALKFLKLYVRFWVLTLSY